MLVEDDTQGQINKDAQLGVSGYAEKYGFSLCSPDKKVIETKVFMHLLERQRSLYDVYKTSDVCDYEPMDRFTITDKDGEERDSDEASFWGSDYQCSNCGNVMLGEESDWGGWFDVEDGPQGGLIYTPHFSFCPYCGCRVRVKDWDAIEREWKGQ